MSQSVLDKLETIKHRINSRRYNSMKRFLIRRNVDDEMLFNIAAAVQQIGDFGGTPIFRVPNTNIGVGGWVSDIADLMTREQPVSKL